MLAICAFKCNIYFAAYEARRHVEFTEGSRAITTMDQFNSAYHEAAQGPLRVAAGILGSTQDTHPPQPLQPAPQSPPPPDLSPRSGSGRKRSQAEWGGCARCGRTARAVPRDVGD
jgi:hypothetical protein